MSEVSEHMTQQTLVPAYVWQDAAQREALVTKTAQVMLQRLDLDGFDVVGDFGDAQITPTFLQAAVGELNDVRFVAYELCEPGVADLVYIAMTVQIKART